MFDLMATAGAGAPNMHAIGTWECEEPEEGAPRDQDQVTWVFKTRDGQVRRRETVRLTQRTAHTDRFTTLLERLHQSSTAPRPTLTAPAQLVQDDDSAAVVAGETATMDDDATPTVDSSAPPAATTTTTRARSLSPPPYVPVAPRTLIYNEEDEFQLVATALNDDERALAHARERAEYRKLALSALAEIQDLDQVEVSSTTEAAAAGAATTKPLPKVEGFAQADDDDDDEIFEALRLRGGAGGEASDSTSEESSSDSDSDSSSDSSDSDEASQRADTAGASSSSSNAQQNPAALKETLTALFKPGSAAAAPTAGGGGDGGFSLFADMDLDLDGDEAEPADEGVAIPLAPPIDTVPISRPLPSSVGPGPMRNNNSRFGGPQVSSGLGLGGPSKPFFLFPSGPFEDENRPGEVDEVEVAKLGLPAVSLERAKDESRRRIFQDAPAKDFWRHESQCVAVLLFLRPFTRLLER